MKTFLTLRQFETCQQYALEREMKTKHTLEYVQALWAKISSVSLYLTDDVRRWLDYLERFIDGVENCADTLSDEDRQQYYAKLITDTDLADHEKVFVIMAVQSLSGLAEQLENIIEMIETDHAEFLTLPLAEIQTCGGVPEGWKFRKAE